MLSSNNIYNSTFKRINSCQPISRENNILKNMNSDLVVKCWEAFSANILKNYHMGKGTYIHNFGSFTFENPFYSLEGCNNQTERDKRLRHPVFIVSNEFLKGYNIKSGIISDSGTITHYEQKLNNNISCVKLNISEISLSLGIPKVEVGTIIDNILRYISDKIKIGEFKNKEIPGVGILIYRNKILAVKFTNELCNYIKDKPNKFNEYKKHINLSSQLLDKKKEYPNATYNLGFNNNNKHTNNYNSSIGIRNLPNLCKSINCVRPQTSLLCKITPDAQEYLNNNLDINIKDFNNEQVVESWNTQERLGENAKEKLINDAISINDKTLKNNLKSNLPSNISLKKLNIKNSILEDIIYQKYYLISKMKELDINKSGYLNKDKLKAAFIKLKIKELSEDLIDEILSIYISKLFNKTNSNNNNFNKSFNNTDLKKSTNVYNNNIVKNTFNSISVNSFDFMSLIFNLIKDIKELLVKDRETKKFNNSVSNFKTFSKDSFKNKINTNKSYINHTNSVNDKTTSADNLFNYRIPETNLNNVKPELITIKSIAQKIKEKNAIMMNQIISSIEFMNILRNYSVVYPHNKIIQVLNYLELEPKFFTLSNFFKKLDNCKILTSETLTDDIINAIKQIKDIVYTNGGPSFFFENYDQLNNKKKDYKINKKEFVNKIKSKLIKFSDEFLEAVFFYITKMDRDMNFTDFNNFFQSSISNVNEKLIFKNNDNFVQIATEIILSKMKRRTLNEDEYFDMFLRFKSNRTDNFLNRYDFHNCLKKDNYEFSAEEIDLIFNAIDNKKDNIIDRNEFTSFLRIVHDPVYKLQDTIKKYNLEIEEILFRMNIDINKQEVYDFFTFKSKMLLLNSGFSHDFIFSVFCKLKNADDKVSSKRIIDELNVFKKLNFNNLNTNSFKNTFLDYYKKNANYKELKTLFENSDLSNSGYLKKVEFSKIVKKFNKPNNDFDIELINNYNKKIKNNSIYNQEYNKITKSNYDIPDYKDEDIMKLCRICDLLNKNGEVNYTKFLEILFYNKLDNQFNNICDYLVQKVEELKSNNLDKKDNINNNNISIKDKIYNKLISDISSGVNDTKVSISVFKKYISDNINISLSNLDANLFDVDKDGYISYLDIKSILERYINTHYFKYESIANNKEDKEYLNKKANFFCIDEMTEEKFKNIVDSIKNILKTKNLTDVGFFNKLDTNKDGFVSAPEFNKNIDSILPMSSNIKDQFFSFLDVRKLGLVDLETFKKRFKSFSSLDVLIKNNWETENKIISSFNNFLKIDCLDRKLTIYEIFAFLDKDSDGKVNVNDFKSFILEKLLFSPYEINNFKLERVLQHISKSKVNFLTIHDIKEYINDFILENNCEAIEELNLKKQTFNMSTIENKDKNKNSNLVEEKNLDWINSVFEKFGLFVSEKYSSFEKFFESVNNNNSNSDKIKINDFINYIDSNYLSLKGFNLTKDELINFFSAFDSHKKSFITLDDVKHKLGDYNIYIRMNKAIKTFLQNNFKNGAEAFLFFLDNTNGNNVDNNNNNNNNNKLVNRRTTLTVKELFDGINFIFPETYSTHNILVYIEKYFTKKYNNDKINFSDFNFVFFNKITDNNAILNYVNNNNNLNQTKLFGRLIASDSSKDNKLRANSACLKYNNSSYNPKVKLVTPYDADPLEKLRRLLKSSRFNYSNFFTMYELLHDGFINQFEFRNMLKKLNIGLTSLEIDEIIRKSGKNRQGLINMKEFIKFIKYEDPCISKISDNLKLFISDLKQLVYKYYANPRLAFQFVILNIIHCNIYI